MLRPRALASGGKKCPPPRLLRRDDEGVESTTAQRPALDSQERGGGEVRLLDGTGGREGQISDGGEVVEVHEAVTGCLQRDLNLPQFLVLDLQLDLMDLEFVLASRRWLARRSRLRVAGKAGFRGFPQLRAVVRFGLLRQITPRTDWRFPLIGMLSFSGTTCTVESCAPQAGAITGPAQDGGNGAAPLPRNKRPARPCGRTGPGCRRESNQGHGDFQARTVGPRAAWSVWRWEQGGNGIRPRRPQVQHGRFPLARVTCSPPPTRTGAPSAPSAASSGHPASEPLPGIRRSRGRQTRSCPRRRASNGRSAPGRTSW